MIEIYALTFYCKCYYMTYFNNVYVHYLKVKEKIVIQKGKYQVTRYHGMHRVEKVMY